MGQAVKTAPLILDASALLAVLFSEPGSETVQGSHAVDSPAEAIADLAAFQLPVIPWDEEAAHAGADLCRLAKTHGLSLGDRECLTTARLLRRKVLTAERKWRSYQTWEFRFRSSGGCLAIQTATSISSI